MLTRSGRPADRALPAGTSPDMTEPAGYRRCSRPCCGRSERTWASPEGARTYPASRAHRDGHQRTCRRRRLEHSLVSPHPAPVRRPLTGSAATGQQTSQHRKRPLLAQGSLDRDGRSRSCRAPAGAGRGSLAWCGWSVFYVNLRPWFFVEVIPEGTLPSRGRFGDGLARIRWSAGREVSCGGRAHRRCGADAVTSWYHRLVGAFGSW